MRSLVALSFAFTVGDRMVCYVLVAVYLAVERFQNFTFQLARSTYRRFYESSAMCWVSVMLTIESAQKWWLLLQHLYQKWWLLLQHLYQKWWF